MARSFAAPCITSLDRRALLIWLRRVHESDDTMTTNKSRNALDGSITSVRKNLSVYKVKASPFYRARAWLPSLQKRVVRSTKATSRIDAIRTAEEWYAALQASGALTKPPVNQTFIF